MHGNQSIFTRVGAWKVGHAFRLFSVYLEFVNSRVGNNYNGKYDIVRLLQTCIHISHFCSFAYDHIWVVFNIYIYNAKKFTKFINFAPKEKKIIKFFWNKFNNPKPIIYPAVSIKRGQNNIRTAPKYLLESIQRYT